MIVVADQVEVHLVQDLAVVLVVIGGQNHEVLHQEEVEVTAEKRMEMIKKIVDLDPDLDLGLAHLKKMALTVTKTKLFINLCL